MSFSVNKSKVQAKKPSKKIGNLFSDAWKKGTVIEKMVYFIDVNLYMYVLIETTQHWQKRTYFGGDDPFCITLHYQTVSLIVQFRVGYDRWINEVKTHFSQA